MTHENEEFIPRPSEMTEIPIQGENPSNTRSYSFQQEDSTSKRSYRNPIITIICGLVVFVIILGGLVFHHYRGKVKNGDGAGDVPRNTTESSTTQNIEDFNDYDDKQYPDVSGARDFSRNVTESPTTPNIGSLNDEYYDEPEHVNSTSQPYPSPYENHTNFKNFPSVCGLPSSRERIQNGEVAPMFEHPWLVPMFVYNKTIIGGKEINHCGASLLSDRIILTAAHCIILADDIKMSVRVGEYHIDTDPDCDNSTCAPNVQIFNDTDFDTVVHPGYSGVTGQNDIALIKLKQPAKLNENAMPLCLPLHEEEMPLKFIIVGYGLKIENMKQPVVPYKATVETFDHNKCISDYKRIDSTRVISDKNFCAMSFKNVTRKETTVTVVRTVDSCKGDSGSPAIWPPLKTAKFTQFGIVSWGLGGCGTNKTAPGVYTKIASYLPWILDNSSLNN